MQSKLLVSEHNQDRQIIDSCWSWIWLQWGKQFAVESKLVEGHTAVNPVSSNANMTPNLKYAFGEFISEVRIRNLSQKTERYYEQQLRPFLHFCSEVGSNCMTDIQAVQIRRYLRNRRNDGLADNSIRAAYRAIKAFLNFCVQEELIEESPMAKVRMPKCEKRILPALELSDFKILLDACEIERDRAIVMTLVDTGVRSSELIGMNGDDVDLSERRIRVHGKGRKDRYVYISERTRNAIADYFAVEGQPGETDAVWLSTTYRTPLTRSGLRQLLERLGNRTGIDHTNPHSFRRSFAITCLRNGMDIFKLSRLMGHEDIAILRTYLPLVDADSRAAHAEYGPLVESNHEEYPKPRPNQRKLTHTHMDIARASRLGTSK